jgi:hypothetical protein
MLAAIIGCYDSHRSQEPARQQQAAHARTHAPATRASRAPPLRSYSAAGRRGLPHVGASAATAPAPAGAAAHSRATWRTRQPQLSIARGARASRQELHAPHTDTLTPSLARASAVQRPRPCRSARRGTVCNGFRLIVRLGLETLCPSCSCVNMSTSACTPLPYFEAPRAPPS